MNEKELFQKISKYPEYKEFRKEQKKNVRFYSIINILLCVTAFLSHNGELVVFADFLFTAFVVSLIGLSFYTIRKPSVKQGIISKKEQKGQTYTHTVVDEAKNIICVYRTLKETSYQENDTVFVLNDSYLIKERSELCEA